MYKILQKINCSVEIPYSDDSKDKLRQLVANTSEKDAKTVNYYVTKKPNAYLPEKLENEKITDEELLYDLEVIFQENHLDLRIPYFPTHSWLYSLVNKILDSLSKKFEVSMEVDEKNYKIKYSNGFPHPLLDNKDVFELINDKSTYYFEKKTVNTEQIQLSNRNLELDNEISIYSLNGPNHSMGIHYLPDVNSYEFTSEYTNNPEVMFEKLVYELLKIHSDMDLVDNPYEPVIETKSLLPWLYKHGAQSLAYWEAAKHRICLPSNKVFYRDTCYDEAREYDNSLCPLKLRRMEVDLFALFDYEYKITKYNSEYFIDRINSVYNRSEVSKLAWWDGLDQKKYIDSKIPRYYPSDFLSYPYDITNKHDILMYNCKEMPIDIIVQMIEYKPIIPINNKISIEDGQKIAPFGWVGKPIGVRINDDKTSIREILDYIEEDKYIIQYWQFEEGYQLQPTEVQNLMDFKINDLKNQNWL